MEIIEIERRAFDAGWWAKTGGFSAPAGETREQAWCRFKGISPLKVGDVVRLKERHGDGRIDDQGGVERTGVVRQVFEDQFLSIEWSNGRRIRHHPDWLERAEVEHELGRR